MQLILFLCASVLAAGEQTAPPLKAGLAPHEAAATMTAPDGFRIKLAAGEPLVHQPIAFSLDDRGRIWVAEAYTYPNRAPQGQGCHREPPACDDIWSRNDRSGRFFRLLSR